LAAKWPTTFYGQLAAVALGDTPAELNARILALRDPAWTPPQAVTFLGRELARAAMVLVAWGEPWRARPFLLRLQDASPDPIMQSMAARLALGFGLPDQAVAIARHAGRDGLILADTGWPTTVTPPAGPVEPAVTLGVIRQESGFDVNAASPAGARGLMQLMPGTAADMARQLGVQPSLVSLTGDPQENMKLGTTYLQGLLDRFGGSLALALAAYNAGPGHVLDWLTTIGDPRAGAIDMIDWIELIPFGETRNYVQRVIENVAVYRARLGVTAPYPLAPWRG
jgi:soluble lytic murein transglycosylase